ncbi:beta-glucosidase 1A [Kockovaella imperatae]|uniref:beta-glucosidase n=1 Tax=Kockovaella imperatae TaxID=4999 RepID=A0A1Y1UBI6_9TREE|nr:beta-glucosidase 1A [Kockovaella imperatae]ORX35418.1 beta-glucosidase 1A [Kockovaella imperatae]
MPLRKDFLYGFATAAAQIEGGGKESEEESGRGPSIWDKFCEDGRTLDGSHVNRTCNHYGMFKEDVAMMKSLGANSYRFSISWPRLIPRGGRDDPVNEKGIKFYNDLIDELLAQGLTPFATIYHWDLPLALQEKYDGWNSPEVVKDYVRYAKLCFDSFGDRVKNWLTFNEPYVTSILGHGYGEFAPAHKSNTEPWITAHHQILAHAYTVDLYRKQYKPKYHGQIGITLNGDWSEPWDETPENIQAQEDRLLGFIGWFADPIYLGSYPKVLKTMLGNRLPDFTEEEIRLVKGSSDFYGMNTYTTTITQAGGDDELATKTINGHQRKDGTWIGTESSLKWLRSVPWGVRKLLNWIYKRYQMPIYMTENGFAIKGESDMSKEEALHDKDRVDYYQGYLENILQAVEEDGVDVRSYFGWSFLDNFEWASGLGPRFGCVYTDYNTFERTPKDSAKTLMQFFEEHVSK